MKDTAAFQDYLAQTHQRALPMICANPDLVVQRGAFQKFVQGLSRRIMPPWAALFAGLANPMIRYIRLSITAAVCLPQICWRLGIRFKTDVRGAQAQGMDVLFVATGIHGREVRVDSNQSLDMDRVQAIAQRLDAIPTYAADAFTAL